MHSQAQLSLALIFLAGITHLPSSFAAKGDSPPTSEQNPAKTEVRERKSKPRSFLRSAILALMGFASPLGSVAIPNLGDPLLPTPHLSLNRSLATCPVPTDFVSQSLPPFPLTILSDFSPLFQRAELIPPPPSLETYLDNIEEDLTDENLKFQFKAVRSDVKLLPQNLVLYRWGSSLTENARVGQDISFDIESVISCSKWVDRLGQSIFPPCNMIYGKALYASESSTDSLEYADARHPGIVTVLLSAGAPTLETQAGKPRLNQAISQLANLRKTPPINVKYKFAGTKNWWALKTPIFVRIEEFDGRYMSFDQWVRDLAILSGSIEDDESRMPVSYYFDRVKTTLSKRVLIPEIDEIVPLPDTALKEHPEHLQDGSKTHPYWRFDGSCGLYLEKRYVLVKDQLDPTLCESTSSSSPEIIRDLQSIRKNIERIKEKKLDNYADLRGETNRSSILAGIIGLSFLGSAIVKDRNYRRAEKLLEPFVSFIREVEDKIFINPRGPYLGYSDPRSDSHVVVLDDFASILEFAHSRNRISRQEWKQMRINLKHLQIENIQMKDLLNHLSLTRIQENRNRLIGEYYDQIKAERSKSNLNPPSSGP